MIIRHAKHAWIVCDAFETDEKTILIETGRHNDVFGSLFLTNKRLILEHASGILLKEVHVTLDLRLEGVEHASVEGTFKTACDVC